MATLVSRFLRKITRTKTEQEDGNIDFPKQSRSFELTKSVQMLTGSCFNGALFIVVGLAVKSIAGPAMLLSIVLGAAVAMLNALTLAELCTSFQNTTSFYTIIYTNVGELCAFMVGWFRVLQSILLIALVSCAAGENIHYLVKPFMKNSWLPGHISWAEVRVDDLVFILAFLALLALLVAAGLPYFSAYVMALFWIGLAVFLCMLVVIIYYAGSLNWSFPTQLEPFHFDGMMQGTAVTTIFFTRLDKVVEQAAFKTNTSSNTTCASLAFSLLIVALYYLCSTLFLTILSPFDMLSEKVTLPKVFSLATLHSSKYILSAAAILVFCLAITEAYFDAQKLINLMAEDGLVSRKFANRRRVKQSRDWKRVPALSVLVISISSIPLLTWLRLENLILGFCIASMMISIVINSTAIVVQYKPTLADTNPEANEDTCLPKWEYNRYTIIRVLLCFGYITHERCLSALGVSEKTKAVNQTSKLVNCLVVQYILSCIGLSLAMFHGLPVIGWMFWIMLGALILLILSLFLTVRMILIQPRAKESLFESNFVSSFVPLLNIALFLILLVSIKWIAFAAVGVWLGLGKITCKSHCMAFFFFFTVKYTLQT